MIIPSIIAIDGPAASGKSTLGEMLSARLGYLYFDTGVMYRTVTFAALERFQSVDDEAAVSKLAHEVHIDVRPPTIQDGRKCDVLLDGRDVTWDIRQPEVEAHVSQVSAYAGVRQAMTEQQRRIGGRGGAVVVGRDIGTVVFPDAGLKIYLEASVEERARRRFMEQEARGGTENYASILKAMQRRDKIDSTRALAPLKPAPDAIIINSDGLGIEDVYKKVLRLLK